MNRIVIQNFGPIKNADIEIKKTLVLIGEQATGKSTVAKLIYFFRTVVDDFLIAYYSVDTAELNLKQDFSVVLFNKFIDFFGFPFALDSFNIIYYYSDKKYIELQLNQNKSLNLNIDSAFYDDLTIHSIERVKNEILANRNKKNELLIEEPFDEQRKLIAKLRDLINGKLFEQKRYNKSLYQIAGREATVTFSDFYEKSFFAEIKRKVDENRLKGIEEKVHSFEEFLMFQFMEYVSELKDFFNKTGSFSEAIYVQMDLRTRQLLLKAEPIINEILKGKYHADSFGEKILVNGTHVMLKDASSGQKESIRILQDLFYVMFNHRTVHFRIIEEPEAHLFPTAQKKLVELMALMRHTNPENELIITTHSPYILTSINNLLYAKSISALDEKVNHIIAPEVQLDPTEFAAYALGDFYDTGEHCHDIFNKKTGVIDQSFLDTVSEMLGEEFDQLYRIHAKSLREQQ